MVRREGDVGKWRRQAIAQLESFLQEYPAAPQRADALFRLAELTWENAEADLLSRMATYDQRLTEFKQGKLTHRPAEPSIVLSKSLKIYEEILEKHPGFARSDMVLYLYGFGLNEKGNEQAALSMYRSLHKRFPESAFVPDAHLAIAEFYFAQGDFRQALASYERVLKHPDTPLIDLALYKTAWCHFKLGRAQKAALRFRQVLSRGDGSKKRLGDPDGKLAMDLKKEALEDLALTFSESGGAQDAYRFMKEVGGEEYSIRVLQSLGEVFFHQARFAKAAESYRILIDQFPLSLDNPSHRVRVAAAYERSGEVAKSLQERRAMAKAFGPGSAWRKKNAAQPTAIADAEQLSEENLRYVALYHHKTAQKKPSRKAYEISAAAYREYLKHFPTKPEGAKIGFYLGDVLFKLKKYQEAAHFYLVASKRLKDPSMQVEAAYAAVLAFDKLRKIEKRPGDPPTKKLKLKNSEQGFVEAVDAFAKLAPVDKKLPQLRFEQGETYYYRGQFQRAAQFYLALVQNHPKDHFAEAAADLALDCFRRRKDWRSLENRARRFRERGSFRGRELDGKLEGFIVSSVFQAAASLAKKGEHLQAAEKYEELVEEFPKAKLAPKALLQAAANLKKAGEKTKAIATYRRIIERYPKRAGEASLIIAHIYEQQYAYLKAAEQYSKFADSNRKDPRAPTALAQTASLYQAKRAYSQQANALIRFTRRYPRHKKASEAFFQAGLALERAKAFRRARKTFNSYLKKYAQKDKRRREATLHLGQAWLQLGKKAKARSLFEQCGNLRSGPKASGNELAAGAECLFLLGEMAFSEYQKIRLRPPRSRLVKNLAQKAKLLKKAEGLFTQVVAAGHMEWAAAALYRIGEMYAQFAKAIYDAPMPKGLKNREQEVYRNELQSLAYPIEDKALSAFTLSHEMALKNRYYSRWTEKTIQELRKLDPAKFPEDEELLPPAAWANSFTTYPLLLKAFSGGKP